MPNVSSRNHYSEAPVSALDEIRARIASAARMAGRDPTEITLTAVSKQQPWAQVGAVLAAGQRVFGENRLQEAMDRWSDHRKDVELRLIGSLQTNKAHQAIIFFDVIETLDRDKLARVLSDAVQREGVCPRFYIQINTGEEPQKSGRSPREAPAFIAACRETYGLNIEGLMCIPPADEPPGPHFALLAKIARDNGIGKLSMGMSADFEIAIAYGATAVRVGSALFGERLRRGSEARD